MKLSLVFLLTVISLSAFAQQKYSETVYLKNGSIIKGIVLEYNPDENIKIQTSDGSVFIYPGADVLKITKENPQIPPLNNGSNSITSGSVNERDLLRIGRHNNVYRDGVKLSTDELKTLFGPNYNTFSSSYKQIKRGRTFTVLGSVFTGISAIALIMGTTEAVSLEDKAAVFGAAGAVFFLGNVSLCVGIVNKSVGKGRRNWVVRQYNTGIYAQQDTVSLSIAPSLFGTNVLHGDQGALYAVGATLRLSF